VNTNKSPRRTRFLTATSQSLIPLLLTVFCALTACGGGGGGGRGAASGPTLSVSQSSVSATSSVLSGSAVSVIIGLTWTNTGAATYYVRARYTVSGIADVALNLNPPANATVNFKPGTSLKPGTYTDQVAIELCTDSACKNPVPGAAITIPTTYTVTAVPASQEPTITFPQTSVSIQALAIDPLTQPVVTVPFSLANFVQAPYLSTSWSSSALSVVDVSQTSATQGALTIAVPSATTLSAGTHTATINVTACLDSTCTNPVQGSPFQVTVNYIIGNSITVAGPYGYVVQAMQQQVQSMVWDSVRQQLYVVLPFDSTGVSHIAAIDPVTQTMTTPVALDSTAFGAMAISDDSQFVYVGLSNGTVQRLLLPQLTTDIRVTLDTGSVTGLYPADVQVAPGEPHTIAIALSADPYNNVGGEERGVAIFDDRVMRPNEATATGIPATGTVADYLQWATPTSLFGVGYGSSYNTQASLFGMAIDPSGIASSTNAGSVKGGRLHYAQSLLYMDGGTIFNPATNQANNTLSSTANLYGLLPDSGSGRLFVSNSTQVAGTIQLQALNLQQLTPIAQIVLPPLATQQQQWALWGHNGLVIRTTNDLIFVQGGFVGP
jgi:hypothetical protein